MNTNILSTDQVIKFEKLTVKMLMIAVHVCSLAADKTKKANQEFLEIFFTDIKTQKNSIAEYILFQKYITDNIPPPRSTAVLMMLTRIFMPAIFQDPSSDPSPEPEKSNNDNTIINLADRRK